MVHENTFVQAGFVILIINSIASVNVTARIKVLIKALYPEIARQIGNQSILGSSINNSLALMGIITRPPSEITYVPLLRLFNVWKVIFFIQVSAMVSVVIFAILSSKH
jgi:hypothetical protein